jgi:ABC-type branched-subunit amino acid transport system ATPase component/predicted MFS family arabinose efflux permease
VSDAEPGGQSAASLTATVLDEEAAREEMQAEKEILFADDLLPGVGSDAMSLKEGLKKGGASTFLLLLILNSLDELESGAMALLAPDIRDTFGVSNGTITFITAASAAFIALGAFPMGWLADRYRRAPIIGISTALFTGFVFLTGLAVNAFMMFWTRFGVGIAKANTLPVHSSLIADTYPIAIRGRMGAVTAMCGRSVNAIAPVLIGVIVVIAGGDEGWRWAFLILGFPVAFFAFRAFRLPEPPRGQWEKDDVLHSVVEEEDPAPISVDAAFARLLRIRTVKAVIIAFCALGFLLFTLGVQTNIYLEDEFGLDTFGRGVVASVAGIIATIFLPFVGRRFDQLYRRDPARALRLIGFLLLPLAVLLPVQFLMPNEYLFVAVGIPVQVLFASSFAMVGPTVQAIVPYRLRGLGSALVTLYIFLIGAIGGALVAAVLIDAYGPRTAIIALAFPSLSIGALMLLRGASSIKYDLSLIVAELQEELEEHERQREDPELIPAIQVADVDFSYGPVQILFDLNFSVATGETLALLGTNGAGKSTILRVITGLGTPQRGVIRLHGKTITYSTPEQRAAMGIQMLPGGKGTFPNLSIGDNLRIGAYRYRHDAADVQRRIDRVVEIFPSLRDRMDDRAGNLSGGQQQMLALARVMLHDPDVLIIDELSLGLAPTLVQDLLEHIDALKEAGQTMIIVEQSLNVALAVADRAVFLEKGQVRFEGSAKELAERDDLARAVFLGSEGG